MSRDFYMSLPIPYVATSGVKVTKPHDAVTCLDHAVFCVRHGFYREACRYAVRSLIRPVF